MEEICIQANGGILILPLPGRSSRKQRAEGQIRKIGRWLNSQRQFYKQGKMGPERLKKLAEELGANWHLTQDIWQKKFPTYKDFVEITGMQPEQDTIHQRIAIGYWVTNSVRPRKAELTPEWIQRFDDLGFEWEPPSRTIESKSNCKSNWKKFFHAYEDFVKKFGKQALSEFTRHKGLRIGKWIYKEVIPHKDSLSEEQIMQLEGMGIDWEAPTKMAKILERLREKRIRPKTQKSGGSEIRIRVEAKDN